MEKLYFEGYKPLGEFSTYRLERINQYEQTHQIQLPAAYVEFVCRAGDVLLDGWLGGGVITSFDKIDFRVRESKVELTEAGADIGEFVPFTFYNGVFCFFYQTDGDNPPVYQFDAGRFYAHAPAVDGLPKGVIKLENSFTEFVFKYAIDYSA